MNERNQRIDRLRRPLEAARIDLYRLHAAWMHNREPGGDSPNVVDSRWTPRSIRSRIAYRLWALAGVVYLAGAYPLFVLGLATRYYARRIDRRAASLGLLGVVGVSAAAWALLTLATYLSAIAVGGVIAVGVAGAVATASAALAVTCTRRGGRASTVALGYPFGITALFLPPVVAALYSPTLASVVFPGSTSIAIWLLDNVLAVGGLAAFIRAEFELQGIAYVGMWFGLAVPTGWFLGLAVTYAEGLRREPAMELPG